MIWGTVIGLVGGAVQDFIGYKKQKKESEMLHQQNVELEKIRSQNRIAEFQAGLLQEQEKTKQSQLSFQQEQEKTLGITATAESEVAISDNSLESTWYDNITKATSYVKGESTWVNVSNFIIATTRPFQTYLLLIMYFYAIIIQLDIASLEYIAVLTETALSFWFYRRGSEKIFSKKK